MNRRRIILISEAIAFVVVILIPVIHHYQLRAATERYIAELKFNGEPMDLAQVIPKLVPAGENGVPFIINSLTNLSYASIVETNPPLAMCVISPGKATVGWQQQDIQDIGDFDGTKTNTWEDLGRELAAAKNDLDKFQNLTNHLVLDFNLDYAEGWSIRLPYLEPLKRAAQWLQASTLYDLHEGNTQNASADASAILAILQGQAEEPLEISQLVRLTIGNIGVATTWEILQDPAISEKDLESIQDGWQSLEFIKPAEQAYLMERVMDAYSMDQFRNHPDGLWRAVSGNDGIQRMWYKNQWRWFWSFADEKRALQTQGVLIEAARIAETNNSFQQVEQFVRTNFVLLEFNSPEIQDKDTMRIDIGDSDVRSLFSEGAYDSFRLLRRAMTIETARNIVIASIALRRFELKDHHFPAGLDELIPHFLKSAPIDFMDGKPLRYRRNTDGTFLLYSVGENGKDDDGDASLENGGDTSSAWWPNARALDWVWPQPAQMSEVKEYNGQQAESAHARLELEKYYEKQKH